MTWNSELAELVHRHKVCWEVWPEVCAGNHHQQIGYELELFGSDEEIEDFSPCCRECVRIGAALRSIADGITELSDDVRTEVVFGGQSLTYSPTRGNRPDVTLSIRILHRSAYENPLDQSERAYLEKMKARLRDLGACEHSWHGSQSHQGPTLAIA